MKEKSPAAEWRRHRNGLGELERLLKLRGRVNPDHRKEGRVVKRQDDVLSASRYAMMMRRFARTEADDGWSRPIKYDDRWIV